MFTVNQKRAKLLIKFKLFKLIPVSRTEVVWPLTPCSRTIITLGAISPEIIPIKLMSRGGLFAKVKTKEAPSIGHNLTAYLLYCN